MPDVFSVRKRIGHHELTRYNLFGGPEAMAYLNYIQ